MSQTYTILAIVGFSVAALLILVAVIMFFTLHIKQVRDDLTGKTATRSIAEIRSRAKTRKRTATQAAKRYGWEKDEISTDALKAAAEGGGTRAARNTGPTEEDEVATTVLEADLSSEDEVSTTVLDSGLDEDELSTTILDSEENDDEVGTTILSFDEDDDVISTTILSDEPIEAKPSKSKRKKSSRSKLGALTQKSSIFLLACLLAIGLCVPIPFAWGDPEVLMGEEVNTEQEPTEPAEGAEEGEDDNEVDTSDSGTEGTVGEGNLASDPSEGTGQTLNVVEGTSSAPIEIGVLAAPPTKVCVPNGLTFRGSSGGGTMTSFTPKYTKTGTDIRLWLDPSKDSFEISAGGNLKLLDTLTTINNWNGTLPNELTSLSIAPPADTPATTYAKAVYAQTISLSNVKKFDPDATSGITINADEYVQLPMICFDADAPTMTGIVFTEDPFGKTSIDSSSGTPVTTMYTTGMTLSINTSDGPTGDKDFESGVVSVEVTHTTSPIRTFTATQSTVNPDVFDVYIDIDGIYEVEKLLVKVTDAAGNVESQTLATYFGASGATTPGYEFINVNTLPAKYTLTYDNHDVYNGQYYKRPRNLTYVAEENYMSLVKTVRGTTPILIVDLDGVEIHCNTVNDLEQIGVSNKYSPSTLAPPALDVDGYYVVRSNYVTLGAISPVITESFCVDGTEPESHELTLDPITPVSHDWVFAPEGAVMTLKLSDATSRIDPSSIKVDLDGVVYTLAGNPDVMSYVDETATDPGLLSLALPVDDRPIDFSKVIITFADMATNETVISGIDTYTPKNFSDDYVGFVTDSADPILEVSYDTGTPSNGYYYNVGRTATVTLTEATFGFVKTYDPRMVIATKTVDGSESNIVAEEFENPSGDGITWIATIPCVSDGDYHISASFTDFSGKSAIPFEDSFVVDTTKPMIMVQFDNNDAESGWYYKAPRTATVTVYEDNFSDALTSVATQANDAAGNGAGAPGISGWSQGAEGKWTTTVHFGQELHYAMQVASTDLAGNVGETTEVPEFVIDMTAPIVRIERVENMTAYANEIAPLVTFEDTNFQSYLSDITIVGASQEDEARYLPNDNTTTSTGRVVDYEDFEYKLDNDDIYTMHATIKDMAGNTAEASVTFSVNRFGSNYVLSDKTKPLIGSYLRESEEIVITETNVSGLTASSVRMAKNDVVEALDAEEDYSVTTTGSQVGWSQYTYTLPAKLFDHDAYYRVMLASHDTAGNYSENLMMGKNAERDDALEVTFAVDGTSPVGSLENIETNLAYYGPSQRVDVFMSDNMEAQKASLVVNSVQVKEWDESELEGSRAFSYDLPAAEGTHEVKIEIKDKAGNTTVTHLDDIIVTNDWFRYVLNTPSILYPSIAGIILAVGLTAIFIGRAIGKRQRKRKAA